jgi:hypothetical protein
MQVGMEEIAARIVREIAAPAGPWHGLRLVGRCAGGESGGAFVVEQATAERWVLKWNEAPLGFRERQIVAIERLRVAGYPIPKHVAIPVDEGTAVLQSFVQGTFGAPVTSGLAAEIARLVGFQAGQADTGPSVWRDLVVGSLTEGLNGWCVHQSLARYSDRSRALLDRIRATGRATVAGWLPAPDLVHLDLHANNVVSDRDRVVAVIDWDAVQTGDRTVDLVKFAFTAMQTADEGVLASLWDPLLTETGGSVEAYVAHVVLNLVDWQIRFHPDAADVTISCTERAFDWVDAGRFRGFRL